jgi:hypothetical protein
MKDNSNVQNDDKGGTQDHKNNIAKQLSGQLKNCGILEFAIVNQADTNIFKEAEKAEKNDGAFSIGVIKDNYVNDNAPSSGTVEKCYKLSSNEAMEFSKFITGANNAESNRQKEYYACFDILNSKAPKQGGVRNCFGEYLKSIHRFGKIYNERQTGLQLSIVSPTDKEVVMIGNTSSRIVRVEADSDLKDFYDTEKNVLYKNTEFRMKLSFEEAVCVLVYAHRHIKNDEELKYIENSIMFGKIKGNSLNIAGNISIKYGDDMNPEIATENEQYKSIEEIEKEKNERIENIKKEIAKAVIKWFNDIVSKTEENNAKLKLIKHYMDKVEDYNVDNCVIYESEDCSGKSSDKGLNGFINGLKKILM